VNVYFLNLILRFKSLLHSQFSNAVSLNNATEELKIMKLRRVSVGISKDVLTSQN
jgi:hypothetical protein